MYLANESYSRLHQALIDAGLSIRVNSECVIVDRLEKQAEKKVCKIVESVGFCPLIVNNKIDSEVVFTISPYRLPEFFNKNSSTSSVSFISSHDGTSEAKSSNEYFSFNEISHLLEPSKFVMKEDIENAKDKWTAVNSFRTFVSASLNQGLVDIISPHIKDEQTIVEIGSGIGYSLPSSWSEKLVRIQPSLTECHLLKQKITEPLYQLDIEGIYRALIESGKKVPLFFALDVFDVIPFNERKASLSQLSQLQNSGDRILMMLDTNPCLDVAIEQLEDLYPGHAIFPYFPLTKEPAKFSVLIVPIQYVQHKPSKNELLDIIQHESMSIMHGHVSQMQYGLHQLQSKFNLKVIELETFFVEHINKDLEQAGYTSKVYYHTSFTLGDAPKNLPGIKQDLIYKSVTDTSTLRQWSFKDQNLLNWLAQKEVAIPKHFNEGFLQDLREKGQKVFGAEILVVEAIKI